MADKKKFTVHTQQVNSYKMVVLTAGIKLDRFKKNPVMLHLHNTDMLTGKWTDIEVDGQNILMSPEFNKKNAFAAERAQEVEDGFLNAASIGLMPPFKWESGDKYGFDADVLVLAESTLKEVSTCPIPSNEDALCLMDEKGVRLTPEQISEIKLSVSTQITKPKTNTMDFKALLIATLNLKADAADADITTALQNMKNENVNLAAEKTAWDKKETERAAEAITTELTLAVKDGKITEEQKPVYEALLKADFKNGKAALDGIKPAAPQAVNLSAEVNKNPQAAQGAKEFNLADKSTYKFSDYLQHAPDDLVKMKRENKPAYIQLCAAAGIQESDIDWNS